MGEGSDEEDITDKVAFLRSVKSGMVDELRSSYQSCLEAASDKGLDGAKQQERCTKKWKCALAQLKGKKSCEDLRQEDVVSAEKDAKEKEVDTIMGALDTTRLSRDKIREEIKRRIKLAVPQKESDSTNAPDVVEEDSDTTTLGIERLMQNAPRSAAKKLARAFVDLDYSKDNKDQHEAAKTKIKDAWRKYGGPSRSDAAVARETSAATLEESATDCLNDESVKDVPKCISGDGRGVFKLLRDDKMFDSDTARGVRGDAVKRVDICMKSGEKWSTCRANMIKRIRKARGVESNSDEKEEQQEAEDIVTMNARKDLEAKSSCGAKYAVECHKSAMKALTDKGIPRGGTRASERAAARLLALDEMENKKQEGKSDKEAIAEGKKKCDSLRVCGAWSEGKMSALLKARMKGFQAAVLKRVRTGKVSVDFDGTRKGISKETAIKAIKNSKEADETVDGDSVETIVDPAPTGRDESLYRSAYSLPTRKGKSVEDAVAALKKVNFAEGGNTRRLADSDSTFVSSESELVSGDAEPAEEDRDSGADTGGSTSNDKPNAAPSPGGEENEKESGVTSSATIATRSLWLTAAALATLIPFEWM